jgi:hypothetical protein
VFPCLPYSIFHILIRILDVQPSNILLAVREEDFLPSEETVKQSSDASSEKQSHSVVASQPIVKEIDRNQRISIKLADFGVGLYIFKVLR